MKALRHPGRDAAYKCCVADPGSFNMFCYFATDPVLAAHRFAVHSTRDDAAWGLYPL